MGYVARAEQRALEMLYAPPKAARPPAPPRERPSSRARRVEILDAVVPVFAARGYARATVSRLEAVVPVSRPTMYHYFPSKAKLYAAALQHEADRVEAVLVPALRQAHVQDLALPPGLGALADGHPGSGLEPTSRVIYALVAWARRNPDSARLLLHRPIDAEEVVAAHATIRGAIVDRVAAILRADRSIKAQRGLQRRFALQLHAEMLVGAAEAVMHWALDHPLVPARYLVRTWTTQPRALPTSLAGAGPSATPRVDAGRSPPV